ncbi:MAG: hypothetical protein CO099_03335 [Bdellovibrio sp. CG_4_9_14_3_um_filter_39_7]|nr:MAG: hypothetical protein CO099_03335 [Bdellovibrio sp. CG_4_9_14_3_um_filter_39_7]
MLYQKKIQLLLMMFLVSSCFDKAEKAANEKFDPGIVISDVTKKSLIDFKHEQGRYFDKKHKNVSRYISSMTSSVAVADINNDGWQDFFISNDTKKHGLYINKGDGTFVDQFASSGIDTSKVESVQRPIFFDYDNDGYKDLFLGTNSYFYLYKNISGTTFKDVTAELGLGKEKLFLIAGNVIDYNKDGFLDLVVSGYFPESHRTNDPRFMPETFEGAANGGPVYVFKNENGKRFIKQPGALGIPDGAWTLAIGVYDFNNDGYDDLWFANDFNSDWAYLNNHGKNFIDNSESLKSSESNNGMNSEIADIDDDGLPVVYVSQIYQEGIEPDGNTLFKMSPDGNFKDVAKTRGIDKCGWSWGAKFIDLDNNSKLDLVVSNGYFSGDPKKSLWFSTGTLGSGGKDFLVDARNWPDLTDGTWGGYQHKCVFYNKGNEFVNIIESTDLNDNLEDGRSLAVIDFLNNGFQSLLLATQNGHAYLYQVSNREKRNWIGFSLIGKESGTDAFGAKVKIELDKRTLSRTKVPTNGFASQSDSRIHFGLGLNNSIKKITVFWPNGKTVELKDYNLNSYNKIYE